MLYFKKTVAAENKLFLIFTTAGNCKTNPNTHIKTERNISVQVQKRCPIVGHIFTEVVLHGVKIRSKILVTAAKSASSVT